LAGSFENRIKKCDYAVQVKILTKQTIFKREQ